jgi:hypothetical protein
MKILLLTAGFVIGAVAVIRFTPAKPLQPYLDFTPMKAKFRTFKQQQQYRFMGGAPWWIQ